MEDKELRIGEDNICPITKEQCDCECCPSGAICNISGNQLSDYPKRLKGDDSTPRQYVESLLPSDYEVSETMTGIIRCKAINGVEEDADWELFFDAIKKYFGPSFREVHHWTCYNHKDFTVYYRYDKLYNLTMDTNGNYITKSADNQ